jgi:hypothetical protein
MYARNRQLKLCVYSVGSIKKTKGRLDRKADRWLMVKIAQLLYFILCCYLFFSTKGVSAVLLHNGFGTTALPNGACTHRCISKQIQKHPFHALAL